MKSKVMIALSGGVDSAVAAYLLKRQGYEVSAVFMQNWEHNLDDPHCSAQQDLTDARTVCDQLSIPFHTVNFSKQYYQNVFEMCLNDFAKGLTPNPDIGCNREIKFKALLDYALQHKVDYLATGHYAKIKTIHKEKYLFKAFDYQKDQTYFLYTLKQAQLKYLLFPLGLLSKTTVRFIAKIKHLINSDKPDSTGICFIGERRFKPFLEGFLLTKPGNIETLDGKVIGQHDGCAFYTIGQRQGLKIGGLKEADSKPWYVAKKDMERNVLVVVNGHDHSALLSQTLMCDHVHWINSSPLISNQNITAKIRYHQLAQPCSIQQLDEHTIRVNFKTAQRAVTPGQSIVFYHGDCCLGGGHII